MKMISSSIFLSMCLAIIGSSGSIAQTIPQKRLGGNVMPVGQGDLTKYPPIERKLKFLKKVKTPSLEQVPANRKAPNVQPGTVGGRVVQNSAMLPHEPGIKPFNFGGGNLSTIYHYSDNLVPLEIANSYPYRTIGIFAATDYAGRNYRCSAALISNSIILTAGHCVHNGGGGGAYWLRSGTFYPAASNGAKPYGFANAAGAYTTSGWFNVGALGSGYDIALVVLDNRYGTSNELGQYTGTLGFCYGNCLQPFWETTGVGYPANYYSGDFITESHHLAYSDGNDYRMGSGMEQGASGGPQIANLGNLSDTSTNLGQYFYRNVAFGVTSWGYIDQTVKIMGSSSTTGPGGANNFSSIYNAACNYSRALHGFGSCTLLP